MAAPLILRTGLLTVLAAVASMSDVAVAQAHPDGNLYEYRYIKGRFVPPYSTFPEGRERGAWSCYSDRGSKVTIGCSFIRGDLSGFDYIFRRR